MKPNHLYLELMKKSLNNYLYLGGNQSFERFHTLDPRFYKDFEWKIPEKFRPHTLHAKIKLDHLEEMCMDVIRRKVPGDFMEAGVWRGGAVIFMKAVLKSMDIQDRIVWVADSFRGIPLSRTTVGDVVDDWKDRWVASYETVRQTFGRYGLLDRNVRFLKGNFSRTLPKAAIRKLAVLRLDCDSYESTTTVLETLYPRISRGGYICIDDWHIPSCKLAVLEYRESHRIREPIEESVEAIWQVKR